MPIKPKVIKEIAKECFVLLCLLRLCEDGRTIRLCSNTPGKYLWVTTDSFPSYGSCNDMANVLTMDEVQGALYHIARNKASA